MPNCPTCEFDGATMSIIDGLAAQTVHCPRCGQYQMANHLMDQLNQKKYGDIRTNLSFAIRRTQSSAGNSIITADEIEGLISATPPNPAEQLNWLILLIGDRSNGPAFFMSINTLALCATLGTCDFPKSKMAHSSPHAAMPHLWMIIEEGNIRGHFVHLAPTNGVMQFRLTFKGWETYEGLMRSRSTSRRIFMAMQFSNAALTKIVDEHFRPEVKKTGFDLFRVDDKNKAGSIDDKIRVDIRTSRILVADLTDANRGAYFEAGFAEGLGKPVIYTCEEAAFKGIHFDTSHFYCIKWKNSEPQVAAAQLKDAIRNTVPDEAIMDD